MVFSVSLSCHPPCAGSLVPSEVHHLVPALLFRFKPAGGRGREATKVTVGPALRRRGSKGLQLGPRYDEIGFAGATFEDIHRSIERRSSIVARRRRPPSMLHLQVEYCTSELSPFFQDLSEGGHHSVQHHLMSNFQVLCAP